MENVDKLIKLLSQTDGRDKLYKFGANSAKIIAWSYSVTDPAAAKRWGALATSIGEGRSLMRMGKWTSNTQKLHGYSKKFGNLAQKEFLEILRIIGDFGYVLGDNLAYLCKYKVLGFDKNTCATNSKLFQFWGFFFAVIVDLWNLLLLPAKNLDAAAFAKEQKALLLTFCKDFCDFLVTLNNVKYMAPFGYNPSQGMIGALGATSGAIATYANWTKLK